MSDVADDQAPPPAPKKSGGRSARREARLTAVQALYQREMNAAPATDVVAEFVQHRLPQTADRGLFSDLVIGTTTRQGDLDDMIDGALADGWTVTRLEKVLRAVLRAGAYELLARQDVPPRAAITEYVDIAHAFFSGREPAMVNGVLDKLARLLRPEAFSG